MDVKAGYFLDPPDLSGLAHFLGELEVFLAGLYFSWKKAGGRKEGSPAHWLSTTFLS